MLLTFVLATALSADCPPGAELKKKSADDATEAWCVTPDGTRHGPRGAWYNNGNRFFVGHYDSGKRTGEWAFWYHNGDKRTVSTYADDARHGKYSAWFEGGTPSFTGQCQAGKPHGTWQSFWANGKPEVKVDFDVGKPGKPTYGSRRGLPIAEQEFLSQKARGAKPGSKRYDIMARKYAPSKLFDFCGE